MNQSLSLILSLSYTSVHCITPMINYSYYAVLEFLYKTTYNKYIQSEDITPESDYLTKG